MLVTNEEAKRLWCPMARVSEIFGDVGFSANRGGSDQRETRCIGTDCMLFEFAEAQIREKDDGEKDWIDFFRCGLSRSSETKA